MPKEKGNKIEGVSLTKLQNTHSLYEFSFSLLPKSFSLGGHAKLPKQCENHYLLKWNSITRAQD